ncbi:MAG: hypothetical protein JRH11_15125 [Deltaproteobacteria bacterium]|nr:hypothetical protein [Deltaproteobacteria bacterium]
MPGARAQLTDAVAAVSMHLAAEDVKALDAVFPNGAIAGTRYPEQHGGSRSADRERDREEALPKS